MEETRGTIVFQAVLGENRVRAIKFNKAQFSKECEYTDEDIQEMYGKRGYEIDSIYSAEIEMYGVFDESALIGISYTRRGKHLYFVYGCRQDRVISSEKDLIAYLLNSLSSDVEVIL